METTNDTPRGFDASSICATLVTNIEKSNLVTARWRGVEVRIKKYLSLEEFVEFVNNVMSMCVDKDNNPHMELLDFVFRIGVITTFTDIELPQPVVQQFKYLYWTDIYQFVTERIGAGQIELLEKSIKTIIG